jgi:hypothetical protein
LTDSEPVTIVNQLDYGGQFFENLKLEKLKILRLHVKSYERLVLRA